MKSVIMKQSGCTYDSVDIAASTFVV